MQLRLSRRQTQSVFGFHIPLSDDVVSCLVKESEWYQMLRVGVQRALESMWDSDPRIVLIVFSSVIRS